MEQGSIVIQVAPSPHSFMQNGGEGIHNQLVLRTANGSSVEPAEIIAFAAFKPPTDFCRHVLAECLDHILKCYHLVAACRRGHDNHRFNAGVIPGFHALADFRSRAV